MEKVLEVIKFSFSGIATFISFLVGGIDLAVQILVIAMVIDYLTGIIKAYINKGLNSSVGFKGILKKVLMLFIVFVAVLIDQATNANQMIRNLVIYYYIANETLSILENVGECGIPVPKKLAQAITTLKKDEDAEKGNSTD